MTWLALDTATDRASVAVGTVQTAGTIEAVEESLDGARQHARELVPMIARVMERAAVALGDIRGIVLADGPGSFTGLRVGSAVAKALADTRRIPVFTAPSLMARAHGAAAGRDVPVLVTSDALRGDVYAAVYRFAGGDVDTTTEPAVWPRARLSELLPAGGIEAHAQPARAVDLIALTAMRGGVMPVTDVGGWEPVYGRPAEAQAQWERTHGRPLSGAAGLAG